MPYKNPIDRRNNYRKWRAKNRDYHKQWLLAHPGYQQKYNDRYKDKPRKRKRGKSSPEALARQGKRRYRKRRDFVNAVKEMYGCQNPACCWQGYVPACCLDFHHLDRSAKQFNIGAALRGKGRLAKEINRCTVLCAICHRLETWGKLDASTFPRCDIDDTGKRRDTAK